MLMNWLRQLWGIFKPRHSDERPVALPPPTPPDKVAIISDVHANLQALEAVLSDFSTQGIQEAQTAIIEAGLPRKNAARLELAK